MLITISVLLLLFLACIALYDYRQTRHAIWRNYPLFGRLRWLAESLRPKIAQYFVESNTDGKPIPRYKRNLVYQRSKGDGDKVAFGTELDLYDKCAEWTEHSMYPLNKLTNAEVLDLTTVRIGGTAVRQYDAKVMNISAMSYGALSHAAVESLNRGASLGGFYHNTGEGGISVHHLHGGDLVWQIGTGYFGCRTPEGLFDIDMFKHRVRSTPQIKMIEIKLSQGAKPGCYIPGHEILTSTGFKKVENITCDDLIWSVSPDTRQMELVNVVRQNEYNYNGDIIIADSKFVKFAVTEDHNIPIISRNTGKLKLIKASDIENRSDTRVTRNVYWNGKTPDEYFFLPVIQKKSARQKHYDKFKTLDWIKLCAWFISEGHCADDDKIVIAQTKQQYRKEIVDLLDKMQIKHNSINLTKITIYCKQIGIYLQENFGNNSYTKKIPEWIKNLDSNTLNIFLTELCKGDGSFKKKLKLYHTCSEQLRQDIFEIGLKCNHVLSEYKDENTWTISLSKDKKAYAINYNTKQNSWAKKPTLYKENYNGKVYCPTLSKNHILIIKYKNIISVNGNSGGILPGVKNTPEIAEIRGITPWTDVVSPPAHSAFSDSTEMLTFIDRLRQTSGLPVGIKMCVGNRDELVMLFDRMHKMNITPDFITIDGAEGGTGAAPMEFTNYVGTPLRDGLEYVLALATRYGFRANRKNPRIAIIVSGGILTGFDIFKYRCLGADVCNVARGFMLSLGCIQAQICGSGNCPTGVATNKIRFSRGLVPEEKYKRAHSFWSATIDAYLDICRATRTCTVNGFDKTKIITRR